MDNTNQSGAPMPAGGGAPGGVAGEDAFVRKWSWGGFFLGFIWALASRLYGLAILFLVLSFIPIVNLILAIYLGIKGRGLVWKSGKWTDMGQFTQRQKLLDKIGIILFFVLLVIYILMWVFGADPS